jgi:hypothetical protein
LSNYIFWHWLIGHLDKNTNHPQVTAIFFLNETQGLEGLETKPLQFGGFGDQTPTAILFLMDSGSLA